MFYRRKIILALLQLHGGRLDKIMLQKLLFLFTRRQSVPAYDFVPHRFGCFSYSANADLTAMVRRGYLSETETSFIRTGDTDLLGTLKTRDREILQEVHSHYGTLDASALMRHTYLHFPFYAIHSEAAPNLLSTQELEMVAHARPEGRETILFTIGYEGISFEAYLVRLILNDVKVLVDVRNNPLSMKYGFSKSQLSRSCANAGIAYIHIPEVGIRGEKRRELKGQPDYDRLFADYRRSSLPATLEQQRQILNLLLKHQRIALTCFEADICQCHRKPLAEALQQHPGFNCTVKHI